MKMITQSTRVFRAAVLLLMIPVCNLPAHAEDLWDIYQLALKNDARFLAARQDFEAMEINLPLARTVLKPNVSGTGTLGRQRSDSSGENLTGNSHEVSLQLNYTLYNRPILIEHDQTKLKVENALLRFEIARDDLILRVAERYFNLLAARDAKEVAKRQKIAIKRQMDLAEERLQVGLGTQTDLFDSRARFQQADADLIAADIEISNARQALIEIINATPQSISQLSENSPLNPPQPNDLEHWTNLAQSENLVVKSEYLNVQVARFEVERRRAGGLPTVKLEGSHRWYDNDFRPGSSEYQNTSLKVTLDVPLYSGGRLELQTLQAGLLTNAAELRMQAARRNAKSATRSAFLAITGGISQVGALAEAIVAGESALQAKEEGFRAGLTTNLDVLDAQRDLSVSHTNYLRARYNYLLSILRLEQATGDLGDEDIQLINGWLSDHN